MSIELVIAFFLICGIVFVEEIDVFMDPIVSKVSYVVLLLAMLFVTKEYPALGLLSAVLFVLIFARNQKRNFVVSLYQPTNETPAQAF